MTEALEKAVVARREKAIMRFNVAHSLKGTMTYADIAKTLGVSIPTVIAYMRFQNFEDFRAYNVQKAADRNRSIELAKAQKREQPPVEQPTDYTLEFRVKELEKRLNKLDVLLHSRAQ